MVHQIKTTYYLVSLPSWRLEYVSRASSKAKIRQEAHISLPAKDRESLVLGLEGWER